MKHLTIIALLFMISCTPSPPKNEEIAEWFESNFSLINELKDIGEKYTSLKRVEPALKKYTDYYGTPTTEDIEAEKRVFEIVEELDIDFVSYERRHPEFKDLAFMSVPAYRWGLGLGGYSVSVLYAKDPGSVKRISENSQNHTYKDLGRADWHIEVSDTR